MIIEGWFELLAKIVIVAQRDLRSKDRRKAADAQKFLSEFLEGMVQE